jgi:molybdenum cofactor guanylyltransferase
MAKPVKPVTGIILAGGKSSRMGFDKGMAELNGKPMINWVIAHLQAVCSHIIIISNNEVYQQLGFPVYADIYKDTGPLGGILTGLAYTDTGYNLVLACDMPYVKPELLRHLLTFADDYSLVVPSVNGRFEPLCAFYHKKTYAGMEDLLRQGTRKMQEVIGQFAYKETRIEETCVNPEVFTNINTPRELQQNRHNSTLNK